MKSVLGLVLGAAIAISALFDPAVRWFAIPAAAGSLLTAGVLFVIHRRHMFEHLEEATDAPMHYDGKPFNFSFFNPAGIGGLALMAMCAVVVLQFQETRLALLISAVGGTAIASLLITYRQKRGVYSPARVRR